MRVKTKPFLDLTANDLMSRDVVMIPRAMSLRTVAHLLSQARISRAPVVDAEGRCVGVISATDFVRRAKGGGRPAAPPWNAPFCAYSAWQVMDPETVPADEVGTYMTADPVTVAPGTGVGELARKMLDAHIHRLIVVDERRRPIGVVSSTDVMAAVAYAGSDGKRVVHAPVREVQS